MSFQVTVLKVLAGHPGGCLSVDDLKRAVAILISSGPDWTNRTKRLLARAPDLDIFGQSLVVREAHGWQITEVGRAALAALENPPATLAGDPVLAGTERAAEAEPIASAVSASPVGITGVNQRRSRRQRQAARPQRPAA